MRFQVPQFTEIEDKIFGPLTLKQFIYLAGGVGGIVILYGFLPLFLTIFFSIPIGLFALALAFYKIHNQPFIKIVENAFRYVTSSRLYLWKKREKTVKSSEEAISANKRVATETYMPKLTKSKLNDLAWSLDIKEKINRS